MSGYTHNGIKYKWFSDYMMAKYGVERLSVMNTSEYEEEYIKKEKRRLRHEKVIKIFKS